MKTFSALVASAAAIASVNATITNLGIEEDDDVRLENYSLSDFSIFSQLNVSGIDSYLECMACGKGIDFLDNAIFNNKKFVAYVEDVIAAVIFISGKFQPRWASKQLVVQFGRPVVDVLQNHLVSKDRICNEILGWCQNPKITPIDLQGVVDEILATKPESIQNDDYINNLYAQIEADTSEREILRAIQLTDVHLDYSYQPGTKENCGFGACCRTTAGFPPAGEDGAGAWGSLYCDLPMQTFENMLDFVTDEIKPDMIFWTGDNTSHNVWSNTADETTMYTITVTTMI